MVSLRILSLPSLLNGLGALGLDDSEPSMSSSVHMHGLPSSFSLKYLSSRTGELASEACPFNIPPFMYFKSLCIFKVLTRSRKKASDFLSTSQCAKTVCQADN